MNMLKRKAIILFGLLAANMAVAVPTAPVIQKTEPVVYTEDKPAIALTAEHPVFKIKLRSNPTTGYSWFLRYIDLSWIHPLHHTFEPPANKKLMGAPGYEVWTFQMQPLAFKVPSQTLIRFVYERPWDMNAQGKQLVFRVTTQ